VPGVTFALNPEPETRTKIIGATNVVPHSSTCKHAQGAGITPRSLQRQTYRRHREVVRGRAWLCVSVSVSVVLVLVVVVGVGYQAGAYTCPLLSST
jgi:hypothetical protein